MVAAVVMNLSKPPYDCMLLDFFIAKLNAYVNESVGLL